MIKRSSAVAVGCARRRVQTSWVAYIRHDAEYLFEMSAFVSIEGVQH